MIRATWCNSGNIGDRLTPWLIAHMTGQQATYIDHRDPIPHYLSCGSVLAWANEHTPVWGSGILQYNDAIHPLADIRAVRGPLSRARALECGAACPEVYGDPALLAPLFLAPPREEEFPVGVVPHYCDQYLLAQWPLPPGWLYLSVFEEVEPFIAKLCRCGVIISSSLHGLVLADAYRVPSLRVVMGSRIGGDGSKFTDYLASVGRDTSHCLHWRQARERSATALWDIAQLGSVEPLLEPLRFACPWIGVDDGP